MRRGVLLLGIAGLAVTAARSDSTGPRRVETIGTDPDSALLSPRRNGARGQPSV